MCLDFWVAEPRQPVVPPGCYDKEERGQTISDKGQVLSVSRETGADSLMKQGLYGRVVLCMHMGGLRGECFAKFLSLSRFLKSYGKTWHSKQAE